MSTLADIIIESATDLNNIVELRIFPANGSADIAEPVERAMRVRITGWGEHIAECYHDTRGLWFVRSLDRSRVVAIDNAFDCRALTAIANRFQGLID